eukprot:CAMPEP_0173414904 /NCGR_PEP_ID=MMETSP1356-20130122/84572_1 /TAXON_ID=77927 ORGANISM="Hemiselmis virescens, Strain PCC157" /NCGR_SAMPLE_ID=MMETSP1356 /ASSEMBLY_ACC=CAM_ASM_000847 /LENGTH=448 /DNA_ID=CAMNT_0014377113 /DNA_START=17 /DNA_END=1363 /DNA_ORIENTATION=+
MTVRFGLSAALLLAMVTIAHGFTAPMLTRAVPLSLRRPAAAGRSGMLLRMAHLEDHSARDSRLPSNAVLVARDKAISVGPPGSEAAQQAEAAQGEGGQQQQQAGQYQYYEEQPAPRGEMSMGKGNVNKMVVGAGAVAVLAGGYYGVNFYKSRQAALVKEFAMSMMLYWGDAAASKATIKEYKGRVGPLINTFHKGDMFKEYAIALASDKALSVTSLKDFETNTKLLGMSGGAVSKALIQAGKELVPTPDPKDPWERQGNRPSVLGKLMWLTERVFPNPTTLTALRARFPKSYGAEVIDVLQATLTEQAYKDILNANGGPENGVQPGFNELGFSQQEAEECVARMVEENRIAAEEAARIQAEKDEEERILNIRKKAWGKNDKKDEPEAEKKDDDAPEEREAGAHEYECTKCGFTLFVAKGREFKFYGDDFKCSGCGAGKEAFKDNSLAD